jgi:hypothetical protein
VVQITGKRSRDFQKKLKRNPLSRCHGDSRFIPWASGPAAMRRAPPSRDAPLDFTGQEKSLVLRLFAVQQACGRGD